MQKYWQMLFEGEGKGGGQGESQGEVKGQGEVPEGKTQEPQVVAPEPPAAAPEPPPKKEWYYKRIDELTAEKYQQQAQINQLQAAVAKLQAPAPQPQAQVQPQAHGMTQEQVQAEIDRKAMELARARELNAQADTLYAEGVKAHGEADFEAAMQTLRSLNGNYIPFHVFEAALETDSPAEVLYALGKDPEKAMEVLRMPPVRAAARLSRMGAALKSQAARTSNAPEPITPKVSGRAPAVNGVLTDPNLTTDRWMELREKEVAEREARKRGVH